MVVSVIIRTKNEAKSIEKTLCSVETQAGDISTEIVVVDSGSEDQTTAIVSNHKNARLISLSHSEFTFGRALNRGCQVSTGDIFVFLSAHAFPSDDQWLSNLVKKFRCPQIAGVYGRQLPLLDAWPPVMRDYLHGVYGEEARIQKDVEDPRQHFFSNANAAIRRDCWKVYPFNESLPACEDWDWARAMLRNGFKIAYEPRASVRHSHNESLKQVYNRTYRETLAQKLLYGSVNNALCLAVKRWCDAVIGDQYFIIQNNQKLLWLLWTPIYRLAWTFGWLCPYLRK